MTGLVKLRRSEALFAQRRQWAGSDAARGDQALAPAAQVGSEPSFTDAARCRNVRNSENFVTIDQMRVCFPVGRKLTKCASSYQTEIPWRKSLASVARFVLVLSLR